MDTHVGNEVKFLLSKLKIIIFGGYICNIPIYCWDSMAHLVPAISFGSREALSTWHSLQNEIN